MMDRVMTSFRALATLALILALGGVVAMAAGAPTIASLSEEYWQGYLEANPTSATSLGDRRYDDRLDDITPVGIDREKRRLESVLARARAIAEAGHSPEDRLTRSVLLAEVEERLAYISCEFHDWVVDPLGGPQVEFMNLADFTIIDTPQDGANFVTRCAAMGKYLDDHVANLRSGLAKGRTASRDAVLKTIRQMERLTTGPAESLAIWKPATAERRGWRPADRERFATGLRNAIQTLLLPALQRYQQFLQRDLLPAARPPEKAGLVALPGGEACYQQMIRAHTSLELTPREIHQLGLEQVAAFRRDLAQLGRKALGTSDIPGIQRRLRGSPEMFFKTPDEVEAKAREALARAKTAVPQWFGAIRPQASCEVKVMGLHEAPYSTIAYYREPSADGRRPGTYMINTYLPETRPRYEAEALAFHESIPGHHLQIAVAQELIGLPTFRKHQGVTAFVEGWALYTERLADEMGLYSSNVDRLGMLSYDAWRACRLVVDTGLHSMGWTRQQAIDYMTQNSLLAPNNIVNEVDRYLTTPGQALAYKIGQLEILKLRQDSKRRLGSRFDIKTFHDAVLGNGAVPLGVLREQVEAYIAKAEGGK